MRLGARRGLPRAILRTVRRRGLRILGLAVVLLGLEAAIVLGNGQSHGSTTCPNGKGCTFDVYSDVIAPIVNEDNEGQPLQYESQLWAEFTWSASGSHFHSFIWCRHTVIHDVSISSPNPDIGVPVLHNYSVRIDASNPHWDPWVVGENGCWGGSIDLYAHWSAQPPPDRPCDIVAKSHLKPKQSGISAIEATHTHCWTWVLGL